MLACPIARCKALSERQIAQTDAALDRLVYELYGLTEEIAIVEGRRMEVRISAHAAQQLESRKLTHDMVVAVAESPEQVVAVEGQLPIAQSRITFLGKPALLRVAFRDEGEVRWVVTAYPTTKIDKYWQVDDENQV